MPKFTVCCLFYGEHPGLAERLLGSLASLRSPGLFDVRIGMNNCSSLTSQRVEECHDLWTDLHITALYYGTAPYHKYPMMRRMFHEDSDISRRRAISTPYTIWFDDDSWVLPSATNGARWFGRIEDKLKDHEMIGAPYTKHLAGKQHQFIEDQPWYNGKPVKYRQNVSFITGGWWAAHTDILKLMDWPPPEFEHNGGDVMLGEMCRQQGYRLGKFTEGLGINADSTGRCSTAPRRGLSQSPIGVHYVRPVPQAPPEPLTLFDILDGKVPPE